MKAYLLNDTGTSGAGVHPAAQHTDPGKDVTMEFGRRRKGMWKVAVNARRRNPDASIAPNSAFRVR